MSVYNGERHLAAAIESILQQTFRDFEFLIIDDGSTDGSWQLLENYAGRDARIRLRKHAQNQGLTSCLNELVAQAQGEYLARMDADDICLSGRFIRQVEWLDAHPACGVLGTSYRLMDEEEETLLDCHFANDPDFLRWYLCFQNPLAHPTIMARTELFRSLGGYSEERRYAEDYDLWWRVVIVSELGCLPEVLTSLRRHPGSVSERHKEEQLRVKWQIVADMLPVIGGKSLVPLVESGVTPANRGELILGVLACFEKMPAIPPRTLATIRVDAALRLALLAIRHPLAAGGMMSAALKLCPKLPLLAVGWGLRRLVTKGTWNPILKDELFRCK
jgi:hypothetical protein